MAFLTISNKRKQETSTMDKPTHSRAARWLQVGCCDGVSTGRRRLLLGAAATAGTAFIGGCSTASVPSTQSTALDVSPSAGRIDVHHHLSPPTWVKEARARSQIDPLAANWTLQRSLDDMNRAGIAMAVLSVTTPGIVLPNLSVADGRRLARESNEYAAKLALDNPGRFGFFAVLPMLDTEGSLREIAYALDVLKADGIGLLTSYGDKWLGDPMFFPIMEELNRRKAVVYTHPTAANCCSNLQPDVPPVMIEFGTDTTRAIASILFSGNALRFRDIRWIFSHAGGTMPFLIERFVRHPLLVPKAAAMVPNGVAAELQRFYYDTAQVANPAAMTALTKIVPTSRIVFGTDYPYRTSLEHVKGLRECGVFSAAELQMIERTTPLSLIPRAGR
jgi:predicted TIM-barrel fold metal-dependent hydrolase